MLRGAIAVLENNQKLGTLAMPLYKQCTARVRSYKMEHLSQHFFAISWKTTIKLAFFLSVLMGISVACSGFSATGGPGPLVRKSLSSRSLDDFDLKAVNLIVVMPLSLNPSLEPLPFDLAAQLTDRLTSIFALESSMEILNLSDKEAAESVSTKMQRIRGPERVRALELGKELSVDGVLFGRVNRYTKKEGTRLGASTPPAVTFKLWLLEVDSGKIVWEAEYDKRQQPLSENLFRVPEALKSGVGYRSSRELIEEGFRQAAQALEALRLADSELRN